jgi:uncharacterized protein
MTNHPKYEKLLTILSEFPGLAVAFSGGVDSTFLLVAAHHANPDKVIALTARTPYIPNWEITEAADLGEKYGIPHEIMDFDFPAILQDNPQDRCYLCKKALFTQLKAKADALGYIIVDGSNKDDDRDHRPGKIALKELDINSPLHQADLTKAEIRSLSRELEIPTWNKPAYACLLTRFPHGTAITRARLQRVEKAERVLHEAGIKDVRVRFHDDLCRIETAPESFTGILEGREEIVKRIKKAGFKRITLDLDGYRRGSMNQL